MLLRHVRARAIASCQIDGALAGGRSAQAKDVPCGAEWSSRELN